MECFNLISSFYGVYSTEIDFNFQMNCLPNLVTLLNIWKSLKNIPFKLLIFLYYVWLYFSSVYLLYSLMLSYIEYFYSKTSGFYLLEILNKPVIIAYFD